MSRNHVSGHSPYEERYGFSRAIRVGDRVIVAGTAPIPETGDPPADPGDQMRLCGRIAIAALEAAGAQVSDVVRTRMFIVDAAHADAIGTAHAELFRDAAPAATMVVVGGLLDPRWHIELEVEAILT